MPKSWHDRHAINAEISDQDKRVFYQNIVADKKPYFFRYIYPELSRQYNTYIKNTNKNALREFQMSVAELKAIPDSEKTERQREFLRFYDYRMPVGLNDCLMNRICRAFENAFDGFTRKAADVGNFDYRIMQSGRPYSNQQRSAIAKLYADYNRQLRLFSVIARYDRVDEANAYASMSMMHEDFRRACSSVCQNDRTMCDILLDICYARKATKQFVWDMCGGSIIENLLDANDRKIRFPTLEPDGDILYCGQRFREVECVLESEMSK